MLKLVYLVAITFFYTAHGEPQKNEGVGQFPFEKGSYSYTLDSRTMLLDIVVDSTVDPRRRIRAATALQNFGELLLEGPGFERLLTFIASCESIDFSSAEKSYEASGFIAPSDFDRDPQLISAVLCSEVLAAAVMTGEAAAIRSMRALGNKQRIHKLIARQAMMYFLAGEGGRWKPGRIPPKGTTIKIPIKGKSMALGEFETYVKFIFSTESVSLSEAKNIIDAVRLSGQTLLKNSPYLVAFIFNQGTREELVNDGEYRDQRRSAYRTILNQIETSQQFETHRGLVDLIAAQSSDNDLGDHASLVIQKFQQK